ncbi:MAG: leucine-rich repeat domain-containing protein [Pirellulales bacterium]
MRDKNFRPRRWLRFSLRTLLVLLTVVAVWLGFAADRAHRQRRIVAELRETRSVVEYDWQQRDPSKPKPPRGTIREAPGPRWLRKLVGDEYFQHVVTVMVSEYRPGARFLSHIDDLPELTNLQVVHAHTNDDDLRAIGRLRKLQFLLVTSLDRGGFTDAGVAHLAQLKQLENLTIGSPGLYSAGAPGMTGKGLRVLATLPKLRSLRVVGMGLTDEGIASLAQIKQLEYLSVSVDRMTERGYAPLGKLTRLKSLELDKSFLTSGELPADADDAGIEQLARLKNLRSLRLTNFNLTDAGLAKLSALENLIELDIVHPEPAYTEEGVAYLQDRLPRLSVEHSAWEPMRGQVVGNLRLHARARQRR